MNLQLSVAWGSSPGIAAMHLLKRYPTGFALLSTVTVIISEEDDKLGTAWSYGLLASDLQQSIVHTAKYEWVLQSFHLAPAHGLTCF